MTYISTCTAPDLSGLSCLHSVYEHNLVFLDRGGSGNTTVRALIHATILCVDKALRSYNRGRTQLLEYCVSKNKTALIIDGLGELETCITTAKRALLFVERMAAHRENPDIDRTTKRLLLSQLKTLRPIRDAIEHVDADIVNGVVIPGMSHMLFISKDGTTLLLGNHKLLLTELAKVLESVHLLGIQLASRTR